VVVQTLDPAEVDFPFSGTVRLRALEGGTVVETDAESTRDKYVEALDELTRGWSDAVTRRGGRLLRVTSDADAVGVVRSVVEAVR
jgi:L-lactate utilization protein LutB